VVADPQSREHQGRINPVRRSHFWEATG
jgi:hypothetical protein